MSPPQFQIGRSNQAKAIVAMGNHLTLHRNNRGNPMDTLSKRRFPAPPDNPVDEIILALTNALARAIELIPDPDSRLGACARAMREVVETVEHSIIREQISIVPR
jgi:hypothetical protein